MEYISNSPTETEALGEALAARLTAGVGLSAHLYGDALSLVCAEFHGKTFFCVYCPSYYSQPGDNVQPKVLL